MFKLNENSSVSAAEAIGIRKSCYGTPAKSESSHYVRFRECFISFKERDVSEPQGAPVNLKDPYQM